MKIAVIGAGALGCLFGAKFGQENEVIMITNDKESTDIINAKGLAIKETDGETKIYRNVKAYIGGTYNQEVDVVLILVKTTATLEALEQNKALIGEKTLVITLQNGLGNYEKLSKYVKAEQIVLGTTNHNSVLLENGKVFHSGSGITAIGSKEAVQENVEKIYQLFAGSGFECKIVDNIGYLIWKKLFVNLGINAFTYITLVPMGFIGQSQYALDILEKVIAEAAGVAKAEGFDFDGKSEFENVRKVAEAHQMGYSSMSQDRKRGVKTEVDSINGAVVELAKKHNMPAPYNDMITKMVHAIEEADAYNKTLLEAE